MASSLHRLANPTRFLALIRPVQPVAGVAALLLIVAGLGWGLLYAPPDYQQGETVRIMYVHVPAAWMALFIYVCMTVASAVGLIWRHPVADLSAKASAPIGAAFTFLCLVTGALWGQPMWGTWWVWDGRLTSVLILFFLYLGYIALWSAFDDQAKAARAAAILAVVGVINVPIVKFSVDWWNTLHQPASVLTMEGPKIHATLLWPLLLTGLGFTAFYIYLLCLRVRTEILRRKVRIARLAALAQS
ncbi:heme ABC transporter permease [Marinibaculum pumilum]|uniref:Heme exporter protein C n=1 Tax=Marinibaculum pumilum TaxID=1766165 RepID=A0ABV7KXT6_9PROT